MKLSALIEAMPHGRAGAPGDPEITSVTHDSRRAGSGSLFAAFPGARADGRSFLPDAVARGASAALGLAPAPASLSVPYLEVVNPRRSAGLLAARLTGHPAERLVLAGVTGTSGKTTTAFLLDRLFAERHPRRGFFGTLVYRGAGGESAAVPAARTTPEATDLQPMLAALADDGGTAAVMECSSHALSLERLAGCSFDVALFLNLSRDHLDFHVGMEPYFEAKALLFGMLKPHGIAVVNADDSYGARLLPRLSPERRLSFGFKEDSGADVFGRAGLEGEGVTLHVKRQNGGEDFTFSSPLLGRPNAENLLAAAAAGLALGFDPDEIARALSSVSSVPGRLEPVPNAKGLTVLVDYAHKPAALEGVLRTVRPLAEASGGRVIAVFGCGGDRDRGKRPEMGRIAAALADAVIVTSDNPRSEDPAAILADIRAGIEPTGKNAAYVVDRREAIAAALGMARPGDVVLLAGKGHEAYQIVGARELPFDDRVVAREMLA